MSARQKRQIKIFFTVFLCLLFVGILSDSMARPGGGSSFSGGGSSGGGSSGDGGGGIPIEAIPFAVLFGLCASLTSAGFSTFRGKKAGKKMLDKMSIQGLIFGGGAYLAQVAVGAHRENLSAGSRFMRATPLLLFGFPLAFFFIASVGLSQTAAIIYDIIAGGLLALLYFKNKDSVELTEVVTSGSFSGADMGVSPKNIRTVETHLEQLEKRDENFSKVLFLDFANSLYHKYYTYFGKAELKDIKPFLSEEVEGQLAHEAEKHSASHNEIVIGAMNIIDVLDLKEVEGIAVDIEANYTKIQAGKSNRFIVTERWLFNRKNGVKSSSPEKMRDLSCPNCGAPTDFTDSGDCNFCGAQVSAGEMQWFLKKRVVLRQQYFKVEGLGHYAQERGTNLPTIVQPALQRWRSQFAETHKLDFSEYWRTFQKEVVQDFFLSIYDAWSRQEWQDVRHLISDRLFESNQFWIDEYKRENLVNRLERIQILQMDLARIDLDKFYESFTVRVFASCLDYVETQDGKLIGGNKNSPRKFSEYWTFIRRTGVEKPESEYDVHNCPNCGSAADKMGQAGDCGYCGAKVSTGEYFWVLTTITQDEVYKG
jgi:predicted lipid-binding transport protein (Tim44 family)